MILYDFKCPECAQIFEELVKAGVNTAPCPECKATACKVMLKPPRIDWMGMGSQASASPEFIDRFEKVHKQQARIEEAREREHGDYGPRPGAD